MVHTVSGIVLHRLWRMSAASDTPSEARLVIGEMVARVREVDPQFFDRFDNPPMEELIGMDRRAARRAVTAAKSSHENLTRSSARSLRSSSIILHARSPSWQMHIAQLSAEQLPSARTPKRSTGCSILRAIHIAARR